MNSVKMVSICIASITEEDSQNYIDMLTKGTEAWSFFIALVDDHVTPDEALRMTRKRFARTIVDQMTDDLKQYGTEKD